MLERAYRTRPRPEEEAITAPEARPYGRSGVFRAVTAPDFFVTRRNISYRWLISQLLCELLFSKSGERQVDRKRDLWTILFIAIIIIAISEGDKCLKIKEFHRRDSAIAVASPVNPAFASDEAEITSQPTKPPMTLFKPSIEPG